MADTSPPLGEMSIEAATAFMAERCGFPVQDGLSEGPPYCSYPTQASTYLTGALEIERRARARAWTEVGLGPLSAFPDALTRSGASSGRGGTGRWPGSHAAKSGD